MAELMDYLTQAVERRASDLFFVAGGSASAKVEGQIMPLDDERLLPPKTEELLRASGGPWLRWCGWWPLRSRIFRPCTSRPK